MTDAERISTMIDRRVTELLSLADSAPTRMAARIFEVRASEAEGLASRVRRREWAKDQTNET